MKSRSIKAIYNRTFSTFSLSGIWGQVLGAPERNGAWLIWGAEKNGKTTLALMLADYLSTIEDVLYISAEEGLSKNFKDACMRAGISHTTKLRAMPYMPLAELDEYLKARRRAKIVVIDNITVYHEELKYGAYLKLLKTHSDKLFIFLAHEEQRKPYTSSAMMCSRYAKVKIHVQGLVGFVGGRCPGGTVTIDEERAMLYWGNAIAESNNQK